MESSPRFGYTLYPLPSFSFEKLRSLVTALLVGFSRNRLMLLLFPLGVSLLLLVVLALHL